MVTLGRKPGRNDPCSCGSGKKYKFCCLNKLSKSAGGSETDHASTSASAITDIADLLENTLADHAKRQVRAISFHYDIAHQLYSHKKREEWLAVFFAGKFLVLTLRRSESLISGILQAIRMRNYLVALLCTRAHYETLGSLGHALVAIRKFADKTFDYRQLYTVILRLQLGTRRSRSESDDKRIAEDILGIKYANEPLFKAYNVLTLIDGTDKLLSKDREKLGFRQCYDVLSEYCHPNAEGLHVGTSHYLEREAIVEFDSDFEDIGVIHDSIKILPRFLDLYDEAWKLLSLGQIRAIKIRRAPRSS